MVVDARRRIGMVGPRGTGPMGFVRAFAAVVLVIVLVAGVYVGVRYMEMLTLAVAEGDTQVILNEVMASNRYTLADEDHEFSDWVELRNDGDFPVNVQGFGLSDDIREPFKWRFPWLILRPGEHRIVFASNKDRRIPSGELHTNFRLRTRETVLLTAAGGQLIDSVEIDEMPSDVSMGRAFKDPDAWIYFAEATPADPNLTPGWTRAMDIVQVEDAPVYVSEFMAVNRASVVDEDGDFSDWIEFHNDSDEAVNLAGYYLSDEMRMREKWRFPDRMIEPGERLLIYASGKDRRGPEDPQLHTNFRVSAGSEVILFCDPSRRIIDLVETEVVPSSISMGRLAWGETWGYFPRPTPGEANDTHALGRLPRDAPDVDRPPGLRINEVQSSNRHTLQDGAGDTPDWIELHNPTDTPVDLDGYTLSDDEADLFKWRLPERTVDPGSYLVLYAGGPDGDGELEAPFRLNPAGEELFLVDSWGTLVDAFSTGRQRSDMSSGRAAGSDDRVFFRRPTPGKANDDEARTGYAPEPRFDPPGGFHEGPVRVRIAVDDPEAEIRYTLGGEAPGPNSPRYTEPIEIENGSVIRAVARRDGLLPSPVVTHTYLIDAVHAVPAVALSTTPAWLFDEVHGLYVDGPDADPEWPHRGANYYSRRELPAHLELIETDGRSALALDAGIRIYGAFSRIYAQKSFMVTARDRYGLEEINYPLFPDKDVIGVKKVVLSTGGSDSIYSKIRDVVVTGLAARTGLDYQEHQPAVLYINGEYWGLYYLRESKGKYFLAENRGVEPEGVDIVEQERYVVAGETDRYDELLAYVRAHDLAEPEHYEHVAGQIDVDNLIDYQAFEIFFANVDNGNIRCWREHSPAGVWRWILFDVDTSFFYPQEDMFQRVFDPAGTGYGHNVPSTLMCGLIRNEEFKQRFLQRFVHHLDHTFAAENVIARIDHEVTAIRPEMPAHCRRWGMAMSVWERQIAKMRRFAEVRPAIVRAQLQVFFGLDAADIDDLGGV